MNDKLGCYITGLFLGTVLGATTLSLYVKVKERQYFELGRAVGTTEGFDDCMKTMTENVKEKESE